MTQMPETVPLAEMMSRDLVTPTEFTNEAIWLPAMTIQHWNAGQMAIEGKTFTDCLIEGPAVMAVMNGTRFDSCAMGTTTEVKSLLYRPVSQKKLAGVVGMSNCLFVRCRFAQVGFTGADDLLEQFESGIRPLSDAPPAPEPEA